GATRRSSECETGEVRTVPDLLRGKVSIVGRVCHRLQIKARRAAVRELVLTALAGKDRPQPSIAIGSAGGEAAAVAVALAIVVVVVSVKIDITVRQRHLDRGVAVKGRGGWRERCHHGGVGGHPYAESDEIEEPEIDNVVSVEAALLKAELIAGVIWAHRLVDALIVLVAAP